MTDTERERIKAICEIAGVSDIEDLSDGFHTFRQLYYQRMMLFATIVKQNKYRAWKSLRHEDGELCFGGGWFIVGIDTPEGSYTYHYEDNFYSLFDCEELECAKHWDGHTKKDVTRLLSLPLAQPELYCAPQPDLSDDGTLMMTVPHGILSDVKRVMVDEVGTKFCKVMYQDEPERKKGEWIPNWMHNGHEPEENDEYLVTWSGYLGDKITKPMLSICEYSDEWITEDIEKYGYNNVMIHAYMPLPEPYKGDTNE